MSKPHNQTDWHCHRVKVASLIHLDPQCLLPVSFSTDLTWLPLPFPSVPNPNLYYFTHLLSALSPHPPLHCEKQGHLLSTVALDLRPSMHNSCTSTMRLMRRLPSLSKASSPFHRWSWHAQAHVRTHTRALTHTHPICLLPLLCLQAFPANGTFPLTYTHVLVLSGSKKN